MKKLDVFLRTIKFISLHPLNKDHRAGAIIKFLKWQIATRLLKMKVVVPWVDNSKFIVGAGETGLTGNLYAGFMEYEDMIFMLHVLQPDETFVDVGANIGAYTILASKVVNAKSIAFEPLADTIDRLKDQLSINRIESIVDVKNMGVGDKPGLLYFTNGKDTINKVSIAEGDGHRSQVEVTTLDRELKNDSKFFIKIDVEGYEYNVLEGASQILSSANVTAIIVELNNSSVEFGHSNEEIHQKLIGFNFTPVSYDPMTRELIILDSYNKNKMNTIYVKDISMIMARCESAPMRKVHTAFGTTV